jgi:ketol-acid reductoisomerase
MSQIEVYPGLNRTTRSFMKAIPQGWRLVSYDELYKRNDRSSPADLLASDKPNTLIHIVAVSITILSILPCTPK